MIILWYSKEINVYFVDIFLEQGKLHFSSSLILDLDYKTDSLFDILRIIYNLNIISEKGGGQF